MMLLLRRRPSQLFLLLLQLQWLIIIVLATTTSSAHAKRTTTRQSPFNSFTLEDAHDQQHNPLCTTINSLTSSSLGATPRPDGILTSNLLSDFSWISCTGDTTHISYDSQWMDQSVSTVKQEFLPVDTVKIQQVKLRRIIEASSSLAASNGDDVAASITIQLQLNLVLSGSIDGRSVNDLELWFDMKKQVIHVPLDSLDDLPIGWTGSMTSTPPGGATVQISDIDLFDGMLPSIVLTDNTIDVSDEIMEEITDTVARLSLRSNNMDPTLSTLTSSTRATIMNSNDMSHPASRTNKRVSNGKIWIAETSKFTQEGTHQQIVSECTEIACSGIVQDAILSIGREATNNLCSKLEVVAPSFITRLSIDLFVGQSEIYARSVVATTRALLKCDDHGYIGIQIAARSTNEQSWPTDVFLEDRKAAVGMSKGVMTKWSGNMFGTVSKAGKIYTVLRGDLFSGVPSARLVPDTILTTDSPLVSDFFTQMRSLLATGSSFVNLAVYAAFPTEQASSLLSTYGLVTQKPTFTGFLQWFVTRNATMQGTMQLLIDGSGTSATLFYYTTMASGSISVNDTGVSAANGAIGYLAQKFSQQYPSELSHELIESSSQIKQVLTAGVIHAVARIKNLNDPGMLTVDLAVPLSTKSSLSLRAEFRRTSLFPSVDFVYDYLTTVSSIKATVSDLLFENGKKVSLDSNQNLVTSTWIGSPDSIASSVDQIIEKVINYSWMIHPVSSFSINLGAITSQTLFSDQLRSLSQSLRGLSPTLGDIIGMSSMVEASFNRLSGQGATVVAHAFPDVTTRQITVDIRVHRVHDITIQQNGPWEMFDLSRSHTPVMSTLHFRCVLAPSRAELNVLTVTGAGNMSGWVSPFRYQMVSGYVLEGVTTIRIDLPTTVDFQFDMNVMTEYGDRVASVVKSDNLISERPSPTVDIMLEKDTKLVNPLALLSDLHGAFDFVDNAFSGPLNIRIPMLRKSVGSMFGSWKPLVQSHMEWLSMPITDHNAPIASWYMCTSVPVIPYFNVTINSKEPVPCPMPSLPSDNLANLVKGVNTHLVSCGLSTMIGATVAVADTDNCGLIGLHPKVNGAVWSLKISAMNATSGTPFDIGYDAQSYPVFNSWHDFAYALHFVFGGTHVKPILTTISAEEAGVPDYLQPFYPSRYPVVWLNTTINSEFASTSQLSATIKTTDSSVEFKIPESLSTIPVNMHLGFSAMFGSTFGLPVRVNLTLDSNTDNLEDKLDTVIHAPDNTFVLYLSAEMRNRKHEPIPISIRQQMVIPDGLTFRDAMLNWLPTQIPESVRPMFSFSIKPGDVVFGSDDLVRIQVSHVQVDEDTYLMPLILRIQESTVPGFSNADQEPVRSRTLFHNLQIASSVDYSPSADGSTGMIGVVNANFKGVSGSHTVQMVVNQRASVESVASLLQSSFETSDLLQLLALDISVDVELALSQVIAKVISQEFPALDKLMLLNQKFWKVVDSLDFEKMLREMDDLRATYHSTSQLVKETYEGLSNLNRTSFCSFMDGVVAVVKKIESQAAYMNTPLPFLKQSMAEIVSKRLKNVFEASESYSCTSALSFSLDAFCSFLETQWNRPICFNPVVGKNSFAVDLQVVNHPHTWQSSAHLDMKKIFGSDKLPAAVGTENQIQLETNVTFTIKLLASWENGKIDVRVGDGSSFGVQAWFDANGRIKMYLGPIQLALANADISLGDPTQLTATLRDNKLDVSLSGSAKFYAKFEAFGAMICPVAISVPSVPDFLSGKSGSVHVDQALCEQGSLVRSIDKILSDKTLLDFFQDPSRFIMQWEQEFEVLMRRLFGTGPDSLLLMVAIPLLDRKLSQMIKQELVDLVGPRVTNQIIDGTLSFVHNLILNQTISMDKELIDTIVLEALTDMLCKTLKPAECPPVPDPHAIEFEFPLVFKRTVTRHVKEFGFSLGKSNFAALSSSMGVQLTFDYEFAFTIVFSRDHGLFFRFDRERVLYTHAGLQFDPNGKLSGYLGFLGADIIPSDDSGLNAIMQVDHSKVNGWKAHFTVSAKLKGFTDLGFAGPWASKLIGDDDALQAAPHVQFNCLMQWNWSKEKQHTSPEFYVDDTQLCVGTIIARLTYSVRKQADKLIDKLEPILGRDSLLRKKIPVTEFIFGRQMTLAEFGVFLLEHYCDGGCNMKNVREILVVYDEITSMFDKLKQLQSFFKDKNGCAALTKFGSFSAFFNDTTVTTIPSTPLPMSHLEIEPEAQGQAPQISSVWTTVSTRTKEGSFGIKFLLLEHSIQRIIIGGILGEDFDVVGITMPRMTYSYNKQFSIVVYTPPTVKLFIGFSFSIQVNPPDIIMNTRGIRNAIKSGKISNALSGLGIKTRNPDGSIIWPVKGSARITGGATLKIIIFDISAWVYLELSAEATILSVNGDELITFDEIWWLTTHNHVVGALTVHTELACGFGIGIRACIKIKFIGGKCWTVIRKEWGPYTILSKNFSPRNIPAIADHSGTVDLSLAQQSKESNDIPSFIVYGNTVALSSSSSASIPPLTKTLGDSAVIRGRGSSPSVFEFYVKETSLPIEFPYSQQGRLRINVQDRDSTSVYVSQNQVADVQVQTNGCQSILLQDTPPDTLYHINGIPCPLVIETGMQSQVSFTGSPDMYNQYPVNVDGPGSVLIDLPIQHFVISSDSVTGGDSFHVRMVKPDEISTVRVTADPELENNITIRDVLPRTAVYAAGGSGDDVFTIERMSDIRGSLTLFGGEGVNKATVQMQTQPGGLRAVISSNALSLDTNGLYHVMNWQNIQEQIYVVHGMDHQLSSTTLLQPGDGDSVTLIVEGTEHSNTVQYISSCLQKSQIRVQLKGGGNHTVIISQSGKISDLHCTVYIDGVDAEADHTIIIQANSEPRNLRYIIDRSLVTVYDSVETDGYFHLIHSGIEKIVFQFSEASSTDLRVVQGPYQAETQFVFAQQVSVGRPSTAVVCSSNAAMLLSGVTQLFVGPHNDVCFDAQPAENSIEANAMSRIKAPVFIAGSSHVSKPVVKVSLNSRKSGNQHYMMNETCLVPMDDDKRVPLLLPVSQWMCDLADQHGLSCVACHVVYKGPTSEFSITTQSGDDSFTGINVAAYNLTLNLNDGDDTVLYGKTLTPAYVDLGNDRDKFVQINPTGLIHVHLGRDTDVDLVEIQANNYPVNVFGDLIVGPNSNANNSYTYIHQYFKQDILNVHYSPIEQSTNLIHDEQYMRDSNENEVVIDFELIGRELRVELRSDTVFKVVRCGKDSTIILYEKPTAPSINWRIEVLSDVNVPHMIYVHGEVNRNGTVHVLAPSTVSEYHLELRTTAPSGFGSLEIGALLMKALTTDHLYVDSRSPTFARVYGTPSNSECVLNLHVGSAVDVFNLDSRLAIVDATISVSPSLLTQPLSIVVAGTSTATYLDYSSVSLVRFVDGCLTPEPAPLFRQDYSRWWTDNMFTLGIPLVQNCSIFTNNTASLHVTTDLLRAENVDGDYNVRDVFIDSGDFALSDNRFKWDVVSLNTTVASVDQRFNIHIHPGRNGVMNAAFKDRQSMITVVANEGKKTFWNFNCAHQSVPTVSWNSTTTLVHLCPNIVHEQIVPRVHLQSVIHPGDIHISVPTSILPLSGLTRHIEMKPQSMIVRDDDAIVSVTWHETIGAFIPIHLNVSSVPEWEHSIVSCLSTEAQLWIESDIGSNGTVHIALDHPCTGTQQFDSSVEISRASDDDYGRIIAGNLNINQVRPQHILLKVTKAVNASINGVPGSANLVLDFMTGSTVSINKPVDSILIRNSVSTVNQFAAQNSNSIFYAGQESEINIDCSFANTVKYTDGCLASLTESRPIKSWFANQLAKFNIPPKENCLVFANRTKMITIHAMHLVMEHLGDYPARTVNFIDGNVELTDRRTWTHVDISPRTAMIDGMFTLAVNSGSQVTVHSPLIDEMEGSVTLALEQQGLNNMTKWMFNCVDQSPRVTLLDPSIHWYYCPSPIESSIPTIQIENSSIQTQLKATLSRETCQSTNRTLELDSHSLLIEMSQVVWNTTLHTLVTLVDSTNFITVDKSVVLSEKKPIVEVLGDAAIHVDSSSDLSLDFANSKLLFDYRHQTIKTLRNQQGNECLLPSLQCTDHFWIGVQEQDHGEHACLSPSQKTKCTKNIGLHLILPNDRSFGCNLAGGTTHFTPFVKGPEKKRSIAISHWKPLMKAIYFPLVAYAVIFWAIFGAMIDPGLTIVIITGLLDQSSHELTSWPTIGLAIVQSAKNVALNLGTGWFCESEESTLRVATHIGMILIFVCTIVITVGVLVWKQKKQGDATDVAERKADQSAPKLVKLFTALRTLLIATTVQLLLPEIMVHMTANTMRTPLMILSLLSLVGVLCVLVYCLLQFDSGFKATNLGNLIHPVVYIGLIVLACSVRHMAHHPWLAFLFFIALAQHVHRLISLTVHCVITWRHRILWQSVIMSVAVVCWLVSGTGLIGFFVQLAQNTNKHLNVFWYLWMFASIAFGLCFPLAVSIRVSASKPVNTSVNDDDNETSQRLMEGL